MAMVRVTFYAGLLLLLLAQGGLMFSAWTEFGGWGVAFLGFLYLLLFSLAARLLWNRRAKNISGGLMVLLATAMPPVVAFGVERAMDWWPVSDPAYYRELSLYLQGGWLPLESVAIVSCFFFARWFSFPLLILPLGLCVWYGAMELLPLLLPGDNAGEIRRWATIYFGLLWLVGAFVVDYLTRVRKRGREDYAFWNYFLAAAALWGAGTLIHMDGTVDRTVYSLLNVLLLLLAILLQRGIFMVLGCVGIFGYWGFDAYLAYGTSAVFAIILGGIGLSWLILGLIYHRKREMIQCIIYIVIPGFFLRCLPQATVAARKSQEAGEKLLKGGYDDGMQG